MEGVGDKIKSKEAFKRGGTLTEKSMQFKIDELKHTFHLYGSIYAKWHK